MGKEWRCIYSTGGGFVEGKIYKTDRGGRLRDNDNCRRLRPCDYGRHGVFYGFEEVKTIVIGGE